jgi:hypothetical protein
MATLAESFLADLDDLSDGDEAGKELAREEAGDVGDGMEVAKPLRGPALPLPCLAHAWLTVRLPGRLTSTTWLRLAALLSSTTTSMA